MLGPTIGDFLPDLRASAESLQSDLCSITRPATTAGVFNPAAGITTPPPPSTVYAGACRVRVLAVTDRPASAGEHEFTVQEFVVSLPMAAAGVRVDDVVLVTASTHDADLVGRRFVIGPVAHGSQLTARRLLAREVTS